MGLSAFPRITPLTNADEVVSESLVSTGATLFGSSSEMSGTSRAQPGYSIYFLNQLTRNYRTEEFAINVR